jgi:hypothetical protein
VNVASILLSHEGETLGVGKMAMVCADRRCGVDRCQGAAVAFLAEQALCVSHFARRCYEQLERLDPRKRRRVLDDAELLRMRGELEECSKQTLRVCLGGKALTNLERGRLLDILLWAGELYVLLRLPGGFCPGVEAFRGQSLEARALQARTPNARALAARAV